MTPVHPYGIFSQELLFPLFLQSVDDVGDLYIDVADAYTENGMILFYAGSDN